MGRRNFDNGGERVESVVGEEGKGGVEEEIGEKEKGKGGEKEGNGGEKKGRIMMRRKER